jgi:molecular chaperone DnaK
MRPLATAPQRASAAPQQPRRPQAAARAAPKPAGGAGKPAPPPDGDSGSPKPRETVVGIDLGTTNSAVACIENGKPRCIPNADGDRITPSVVTFPPGAEPPVVGKLAKRQAAVRPGTTYYSVKRIIGRAYSDPVVQEEARRLAYKVTEARIPHAPRAQPMVALHGA